MSLFKKDAVLKIIAIDFIKTEVVNDQPRTDKKTAFVLATDVESGIKKFRKIYKVEDIEHTGYLFGEVIQ